METKKVLSIVFSILFLGAFAFVLSWGIINFKKVEEAMSGTQIYDSEDIDNAYQDGYDTALENKAEYDALIDSYRDNITSLNDVISQLNREKSDLQIANRDCLNQVNNLTTIKLQNEETISNLQNTVTNNNETITNLNSEKSNLETLITNLTNEKTNNQLTISSLNTQVSTLQARVSSLTESNENKDAEIASLNSQIDTLNATIITLQSSISTKDAEIEALNSQIVSLEELIVQLQTTNDYNLTTINSLNAQIISLNEQIKVYQTQLLNNDSSIFELNSRINDLEKSVVYYENYIIQLESETHHVAIFEYDGSVYKIVEPDENNMVQIDDPVSTDYIIFNGWKVDGEFIDINTYEVLSNTKIVADVTYKYDVKFILEGEEFNSQIILENSAAMQPEDPTLQDKTFKGWSVNGHDIVDVSTYPITETTIFVALFKENYGLFHPDTGEMLYSWNDLQQYEYVSVDENQVLSAGVNIKRMSGDLYIPEGITGLAKGAFHTCAALVRVYLPESITSIGDQSFYNCASLEYIRLPKAVRSIGTNAFNSTTALKVVDFTGTIEDWCLIAFANSPSANPASKAGNLTINGELIAGTITIPSTITSISQYAFYCFDNEFILPYGLKTIGRYAFSKSTLTSLALPNSIETMEMRCFEECKNLREVDLPSNLKKIPEGAFSKCEKLESIDLKTVSQIGTVAFNGCKISTINIPNTVVLMDRDCFNGCPASIINYDAELSNAASMAPYFGELGVEGLVLNIGSSVKHLPNYLVKGNSYLTTINIPETVETFDKTPFYNCSALKTINFNAVRLINNDIYDPLVYFSGTTTPGMTLNIGSSVERLDNFLFRDCEQLTYIRYDGTPSLKELGKAVFYSCDNLQSFYIPSSVTAIPLNSTYSNSPFYSTNSSVTIYCSFASEPSTYDKYWNHYGSGTTDVLETKYGYTYEQYLAEVA